MATAEDDLQFVEGDMDTEGMEGEMDFPEEWMVLDDMDEEVTAESSNEPVQSKPDTDDSKANPKETQEVLSDEKATSVTVSTRQSTLLNKQNGKNTETKPSTEPVASVKQAQTVEKKAVTPSAKSPASLTGSKQSQPKKQAVVKKTPQPVAKKTPQAAAEPGQSAAVAGKAPPKKPQPPGRSVTAASAKTTPLNKPGSGGKNIQRKPVTPTPGKKPAVPQKSVTPQAKSPAQVRAATQPNKSDQAGAGQSETAKSVMPLAKKSDQAGACQSETAKPVTPLAKKSDQAGAGQSETAKSVTPQAKKSDQAAGSQSETAKSVTPQAKKSDQAGAGQSETAKSVTPQAKKSDQAGAGQSETTKSVTPQAKKSDQAAGSQSETAKSVTPLAKKSDQAGAGQPETAKSVTLQAKKSDQAIGSRSETAKSVTLQAKKSDQAIGSQSETAKFVTPQAKKSDQAGASQSETAKSVTPQAKKSDQAIGSQSETAKSVTLQAKKSDQAAGSQSETAKSVTPQAKKSDQAVGNQSETEKSAQPKSTTQTKPAVQTTPEVLSSQIASPLSENAKSSAAAAPGRGETAVQSKPVSESKPAAVPVPAADVKIAVQMKIKQESIDSTPSKPDVTLACDPVQKDEKLCGEVVVRVERLDEPAAGSDAAHQKDETKSSVSEVKTDGKEKPDAEVKASSKSNEALADSKSDKAADSSSEKKVEVKSDKTGENSKGDVSLSKSSGRLNDRSSTSSKNERGRDKPRPSSDNRSSSRSDSRSYYRSRESFSGRSSDRRRSRSGSLGRSREKASSRYGRSDDRNSSKTGDRKVASLSETRKSSTAGSAVSRESSSMTDNKKVENVTAKKVQVTEKGIQTEEKRMQKSMPASATQKTSEEIKKLDVENVEQLFELKPNTMEQGLWRFSLRISPIELLDDFDKPEMRRLINTAQDCAIYLKNQGQNKKKKGECRLYFNRLLTTKCFMQKLFQQQMSSKKYEVEINRKLVASTDKDMVTLDLDMTVPGTLGTAAATTMPISKNAADDKNVHISNVPKSTTQELLFVVFPTAYSIQMLKDGKDKGTAVVKFRSSKCADDVLKCYTSVSVNKVKLKLVRKNAPNDKPSDSFEVAKKVTEDSKKSTELPEKRKKAKEAIAASESKAQPQAKQPKQHGQSPKVFQIPVLNKRVTTAGSNTTATNKKMPATAEPPDAKRPRLDHPVSQPPPGFGNFPPPRNMPPQVAPMAAHMVPAPYRGGYPAPIPGPQRMPCPPWPNVPVSRMQVQGPNMGPQWQASQRQGFKPDDNLQGTEAISPEWDDDSPRRLSRDSPRTKNTRREDRFRSRGSLSPARISTQYHTNRSPSKRRHSSISPVRLESRRRRERSRSPTRHSGNRQYGRSPQHVTRQSYSPVSQGRLSRSPRRLSHSPRRPGRQAHGSYSPVSQGRLSRSPGRRAQSPRRKGRGLDRQGLSERRQNQSPSQQDSRSYSPISQGRLSRSPGRRHHSPGREERRHDRKAGRQMNRSYSPVSQGRLSRSPGRRALSPDTADRPGERGSSSRKRSHSPQRKRTSPKREHYSERQFAGLLRKVSSPGRQGHKMEQRQSRSPGPQSRGGGQSQVSSKHSYSPGRRSESPSHLIRIIGQSLRKEPISSAPTSSKASLFPSAVSSMPTTSALFPSGSPLAIPGLDLLLKATATKTDLDSGYKPADRVRETALEAAKKEIYRSKEMKPSLSDDQDKQKSGRKLWSGEQGSQREWWREESPKSSPLFSKTGGRESDFFDKARESQTGTGLQSGRDLMSLRQEAAKHLASLEKTSSPRISGLELSRTQNLGRPIGAQGSARQVEEKLGGGDLRQATLNREAAPPSRDLLLARQFVLEMQSMKDNQLSSVPAAQASSTMDWSRSSAGLDRPGLDRAGLDNQGLDRPGLNRPGVDRPMWEENRFSGTSGTWGSPRVQDWDHGRTGTQAPHDVDRSGFLGQNRPVGPGFGMAGGDGNFGPGRASAAGWGSDVRSGDGLGVRGMEQGSGWQSNAGPGNLGGMGGGGVAGGAFGGPGSWLPPPRPVDQQPMRHPFLPRPPM